MDGGAWWAAVHGVARSWTQLSDFTFKKEMHSRRKCQPLQCSCLENPRDGGAWWAAVYGQTLRERTTHNLEGDTHIFSNTQTLKRDTQH